MVRLSASTSRAGGVSAANAVARTGNRSPHWRAGPRSTWHEARARVEAEAEEPDGPRCRLEGYRIVVRHRDVEGGRLHVLRVRRAADGAVVRAAAVGGADDQRLAEPVAHENGGAKVGHGSGGMSLLRAA
jgi:hypothetical protein